MNETAFSFDPDWMGTLTAPFMTNAFLAGLRLVYDRLRQERFSKASADFVMRHFDERYQYALENMRYASSTEKIAEFVFNGILAVFNQERRKQENTNG